MKINLITVGRLKEGYFRAACEEYIKRIGVYSRIGITEIKECRLSENPSEKEITAALGREGKDIAKRIRARDCRNIVLCAEGRRLSSCGFAEKIERLTADGTGVMNIIIGGSNGLAPELKAEADFQLSLSDMTFPHHLAAVMILEQVYRAFQIINGGKYHKATSENPLPPHRGTSSSVILPKEY